MCPANGNYAMHAEPDIAMAYRDDPTSRFTDAMSPFFR